MKEDVDGYAIMANKECSARFESEIYDRQIRLWGADAQAKISKARILYVNLTGVCQEILKNLVLAGVRATLCDTRPYPDAVQTTASFFLLDRNDITNKKPKYASVGHAMQGAVEELNPLLGKCDVIEKSVTELDMSIVKEYDMVVASRLSIDDAGRLAAATTQTGGKFYLVDCFGYNGASLFDLGPDHSYRTELGKNKISKDLYNLETYVPLKDIWNIPLSGLTGKRVDKHHPPMIYMQYRAIMEYNAKTKKWPSYSSTDEFEKVVREWMKTTSSSVNKYISKELLHDWARTATAEVSPVCAVVGGIIGNEIIKAISSKGEPANNCIIFDGQTGKCRNVLLQHSKKNG